MSLPVQTKTPIPVRAQKETKPYLRTQDVIILGAGVSGLIAAATLHLSVLVLESRARSDAPVGADLVLRSGSIAFLRLLGISYLFFEHLCYLLNIVNICNIHLS